MSLVHFSGARTWSGVCSVLASRNMKRLKLTFYEVQREVLVEFLDKSPNVEHLVLKLEDSAESSSPSVH